MRDPVSEALCKCVIGIIDRQSSHSNSQRYENDIPREEAATVNREAPLLKVSLSHIGYVISQENLYGVIR